MKNPRVIWQDESSRIIRIEDEDGTESIAVEKRSTDALGQPAWTTATGSTENYIMRLAIMALDADFIDSVMSEELQYLGTDPSRSDSSDPDETDALAPSYDE